MIADYAKMMEHLQLATAGDDIKLWDCNNGLSFTLLHTFNPHGNQIINSLSWNLDGSFLASCAAADEHVVLTYTKNTALTTIELATGKGVECCDFSSSLRYLLCGGSDGVSVWDLKTKELKKSYKEHKSRVTVARYNWNNSYIASGSQKGEIILHNTVTGQSSSPLIASNVQAIRQLEYSVFRKSMFGTASDDGTITLWDANTRRLLHSFIGAHEGPATGIAFSPINEMLMMSVGLDKRVICYDIQKKQILKVIDAESPLMCIDIMSDGATAAVGSTRGKVHVYDLRQGGNTPIHIFQAHKSSVQSLRFIPSARLKTENSSTAKTSVSSSVGNRRQLPAAPTLLQDITPIKTGQVPGVETTQTPKPHPASPRHPLEIFSPPSEGNHSQLSKSMSHLNVTAGSRDDASFTGVFSPLTKGGENLSAVSAFAGGDSLLSMPSFLEQNNSSIRHSPGIGHKPPSSPHHSPYHQPVTTTTVSATDHLSYLHHSGQIYSPHAANLSHPQMCSSLQNSATEVLGSKHLTEREMTQQHASVVQGAELNGLNSLRMGIFGDKSATSVSPDSAAVSGGEDGASAGGSPGRNTSDNSEPSTVLPHPTRVCSGTITNNPTVPHSSSSSLSNHVSNSSVVNSNNSNNNGAFHLSVAPVSFMHHLASSQPSHFSSARNGAFTAAAGPVDLGSAAEAGAVQREFLRSLVADAMEDVRDDLHRDIQGLHVTMLRQFHNFERETQTTLSYYADMNQKLLLYVHQLEEENKRLKKNY